MKKYGSTRYSSRWDAFTWCIVTGTLLLCSWPVMCDDYIAPTIICAGSFLFILVTLLSVYYKIDGDQLIVYQFFISTAFPINKIAEIKPTKSILSSPAASLKHRIAITFTDRSVLKSRDPLIISPVRPEEFVAQLRAVNPNIKFKDL
ncbi:MAG: PH domain-containing protein [Paramuribaculum sp.]|nr:PH domain-containing protein [Paramuribaculum sp.]